MQKLKTSTKVLYGLGFTSQGIKDGLFQLFLFFYYSQILGLDAVTTGYALFIALIFDAVSDPFVGIISDQWESKKWGRRHPFMFASAIPLGLSLFFLFLPPSGMGQTGLFLWLTIFSVLVRVSLTLFIVPAMSMGAEMTTDYEERTSITSIRIAFGAFIPPFVILGGLLTFFAPTAEITNGMFKAEAYPKFAMLCGIIVIITVLISTWATRDIIPSLPQFSGKKEKVNFREFIKNLKLAFQMSSYTKLVSFITIVYTGLGIGMIFTPYFITYFFGLSESDLAILTLCPALGGFIAVLAGAFIGKFLDKKGSVILTTILFGFFFSLPFNLSLFDLFPENGSTSLLPIYFICNCIAYIFLWVSLSLGHSMMAEVIDEYQLKTNNRQEGLFFSSMSFAYKATVGLGSIFAGFLLKWIAFPEKTAIEDIPQQAIDDLALIGGPILLSIYLIGTFFIISYPITKEKYATIRKELDNR